MEKIINNGGIGDSAKVYEVGYLLSGAMAPEQLASGVSTIKTLIEKNGGVFISEELPKMRNLAYTMTKVVGRVKQRVNQAYFGLIKFEMEPAKLANVKEGLDTNQDIIRFLLIKTVRENTMYVAKTSVVKNEDGTVASKAPQKEEAKAPVSVEELDKSIDQLIIE